LIRSFEGKTPKVHPTAFISEAAYLVGAVEVGENSSVWPGAVIRGDYGTITIGKNTNIQDNCVLHADDYLEVGDNVVVTHGAVLHCHKVGHNVMVGVNAVLLEGVEIGSNCVIGAGSVVLADTLVPEGSVVVGVPGRIRPLKEDLLRRIQSGVAMYRGNAQRFKAAGLGSQPSLGKT
jgi:carbonic anhydrase/acetyltransferase-like protein (isoleucine patch superfamily)